MLKKLTKEEKLELLNNSDLPLDYFGEVIEDDIDEEEVEFPGLEPDFEVNVLMSFSLEDIKRLKKALMKADADLEDLYLAIKLQEAINGYPL